MKQSGREKWMQELMDRAQTVISPQPPRHVLERVGAVLHAQPIRYVDPDLRSDGDVLVGRICVFTDAVLAVVDVDGVPAQGVEMEPGARSGSVVVEFVARATLTQITVESDGQSWMNSPDAWSGVEYVADEDWPQHMAMVDLHYPALAAPVTVPTHFREPFGPFLPSLLDDLLAR